MAAAAARARTAASAAAAPAAARARRPRRAAPRRAATAAAADDVAAPAPLEQSYEFHTPGSVQEPTPTPSADVVFRHQTAEGAAAWEGVKVTHIGDGLDTPVRMAVVIGEFHNVLMDDCLDDARASAEAVGASITDVTWVPGTYEAPLVVRNYLRRDDIDAVVVLGYIEAGSTLHGEEMGATCSPIFKGLELEFDKPVGMGIIGPGATAEQAALRVAYAGNATRAAVRLARHMRCLREA